MKGKQIKKSKSKSKPVARKSKPVARKPKPLKRPSRTVTPRPSGTRARARGSAIAVGAMSRGTVAIGASTPARTKKTPAALIDTNQLQALIVKAVAEGMNETVGGWDDSPTNSDFDFAERIASANTSLERAKTQRDQALADARTARAEIDELQRKLASSKALNRKLMDRLRGQR